MDREALLFDQLSRLRRPYLPQITSGTNEKSASTDVIEIVLFKVCGPGVMAPTPSNPTARAPTNKTGPEI